VLTGKTLVTMLVVASDPSHELLRLHTARAFSFGYEVLGIPIPQCCHFATAMHQFEFASLELAIREATVVLVFSHDLFFC
jgi:hypothetical protein